MEQHFTWPPPTTEKTKPAQRHTATGSRIQLTKSDSTSRPRKWKRILGVFLAGRSLHRFEAEPIGDHALHSTVSRLQSFGVTILRKEETVPGYMGTPTRVMRYWLAPESVALARELLGQHGEARHVTAPPAT